jgi:flagellar protein FlaG
MEISIQKQGVAVSKTNHAGTQLTAGQKDGDSQTVETAAEKNVSSKDLQKTVEQLNRWLQQSETTHLKFRLHDQLNEYYVEVVNDETNEVIRQIPSKKILDIAAKMQEMIGLLVDEKR